MMPADLSERIARLLALRRDRLPRVEAEIARWRRIDADLTALSGALADLARHPSVGPDDAFELVVPRLPELRSGIADLIDLYSTVAARFARDTVNVGVSGSARVGKSTLLQSISGLGDQQIPTGRDIPVTAVRSRIYHSPRERMAVLRLHSAESFLDEVVRPYHHALKITGAPATLDEFRDWSYPPDSRQADISAGDVALLVRLRDMQQALWSYEADLTGGEKAVKLEDLRPYVAYPTSTERSAGRTGHRYLAVKDVRIDCPFPSTDVDKLGIIDLPGLGEIAADAEEHHLTGLRHDVDVVLLVKRAAEGMAYWSQADAQAINLLDRARGFIRNRGDFVFIVLNSRPEDGELADALRADILRQVNDGEPGKHFMVFDASAADPESVRDRVLSPLLRALADRLPVMDEESFAGARERALEVASGIRLALGEVSGALSRLRGKSTGAIEDLEGRSEVLQDKLTVALTKLVQRIREEATRDEDDLDYVAAIDAAYDEVKDWIENGFGVGQDEWEDRAYTSFLRHKSTGTYGAEEFNRIRVAISNKFSSLNVFFSQKLEDGRREVGRILQASFGSLLGDIDIDGENGGTRVLTLAADLLADASEPCPALEDAIRHLLSLRLEYRTLLQPKMRIHLNDLEMEYRDPATGRMTTVVVEQSPDGAHDLYVHAYEQSRQAAWDTKKALLAEEVTPLLVIYSATEQFEDAFIRSGDSRREFGRFVRSYRDELWPGEFAGITEGHARYARVTRLIKAITSELG
jgi:hypothetical protein